MKTLRKMPRHWRFALVLIPVAALALGLAVTSAVTSAMANASPTRPFSSSGTGTEMSLSAVGCQFTLAGCAVESNGTATSSHLGTGAYVSDLTVVWAQATSNGHGGFCAPASGPSTLTAAHGDTLTLSNSGTVCEVGHTGANVPHTFNGTYTITGGTGRFAHASGSGTETGGDDGAGNSNYSATGSITY